MREIRAKNICPNLEQNRAERNPGLPAIGPQIGEQPLHQSAVVGFTQYLFFVGHRSLLTGNLNRRAFRSVRWKKARPALCRNAVAEPDSRNFPTSFRGYSGLRNKYRVLTAPGT